MVNPIAGLPPTILSNFIQEIEPGTVSKQVGKDESNTLKTQDSVTAKTAEKPVVPNDSALQQAEQKQNKEDNTKSVDYSKLAEIVKSSFGSDNVDIQFKLDKDADMMVMQVIDSSTEEVLKQFPPDITLKIAKIVSKLMETTGQVTNAQV